MEIWKVIPGFPGYAVSDQGRVRSPRRILCRNPIKGGYLTVALQHNSKSHTRLVHRLVLLAFAGPCPSGMECCHRNGKPHDCRFVNLRWDTPSKNALDRQVHGTTARGEQNGNAKLNIQRVEQMRGLSALGASSRTLGKMFGVSHTAILRAIGRHTWAHIGDLCARNA
jgi:hypothetical protein